MSNLKKFLLHPLHLVTMQIWSFDMYHRKAVLWKDKNRDIYNRGNQSFYPTIIFIIFCLVLLIFEIPLEYGKSGNRCLFWVWITSITLSIYLSTKESKYGPENNHCYS